MDRTKYFDFGWKSIDRSSVGRYSSAKTRRKGSAKAVAVYSIRGVCPTRPQPHEALIRKRRFTLKISITNGTSPNNRSRPNASRVGDMLEELFGVTRDRLSVNVAWV